MTALDELAAHDRWVLWRSEMRKNGPTKAPYQCNGMRASSTDPATWASYAAVQHAQANGQAFDGPGFVLGNGTCGIDLDRCRNIETGEIAPWAMRVIKCCRSYTEISPSGTGLKTFGKVSPELAELGGRTFKRNRSAHAPGIEVYTTGRYFAVTGQKLDNCPDELADVTAGIEEVLALDGPLAACDPTIEGAVFADPHLTARWRGDTKGLNDQSKSALAMALVRALKAAGCTPEAVLDALKRCPAIEGTDLGPRAFERMWGRTGGQGPRDVPWPGLQPISTVRKIAPYPIEALPPIVRGAVEEYVAYGQQPVALVACSALAAVSVAAQHAADVRRDTALSGPIGLLFLIVGESGERKTSADRAMGKAITEPWIARHREEMKPALARITAQYLAWQDEIEAVRAGIKSKSTKPEKLEELKRRLVELQTEEPPRPIPLRLFLEDVTAESLKANMALGWPSGALWSDEGGIVVGNKGLAERNALGMFSSINRLWDGGELSSERRTFASYSARGRRFTASLMMQGAVLDALLSVAGGTARASGMLGRFLVCFPASTIGDRPYVPPPANLPARAAFAARLEELLDIPLPTSKPDLALDPPALAFAADAMKIWVTYADRIEMAQKKGGEFEELRDCASKSAENAARIAAGLHLVEHGPAALHLPITKTTIANACQIALWHLHEAARVLVNSDLDLLQKDARKILEFVLAQPDRCATRTGINRGVGSRTLRNSADRRAAAIEALVDAGYLRPDREGPLLRAHPEAEKLL